MKKVYIAIPYTGMEESSYEQCLILASKIIKSNPDTAVYSPIINSHPLVKYGLSGSWAYWEKVDLEWLALCDVFVVVIPREGFEKVQKSIGLRAEFLEAKAKGLEMLFVDFKDVDEIIL